MRGNGTVRKMVALIVIASIICILSSSKGVVVTLDKNKDAVNESETGIFNYEVMNNELTRMTITITYADTCFNTSAHPTRIDLFPSESESGSYEIGPCCDVDFPTQLELFLNFSVERHEPLYDDTWINNSLQLNIVVQKAEEPIVSSVYDSTIDPVIIIATICIFTLFLLLLKRILQANVFFFLYHKIYGDRLFSNEWRNSIFISLEQNANGLRMKEICEETGCDRNTARYHVHRLMKEGFIIKGGNKRYYHYLMSNPNAVSIEELIRRMINDNPEIRQIDIANQLGISRQRTYYYVNKIHNSEDSIP
jgi:predicted transcriptional regulator